MKGRQYDGPVVASGAGRTLMVRRDDPTHRYILDLTGKERPRVLFIGTAMGDDRSYSLSLFETYDADRAYARELRLFMRDVDDLDSYVRGFDVFHVGGGNTANLLDVWHRHGLDGLSRDIWNDPSSTAVFTGGNAGGICWFEGGTTDSYGPTLRVFPEGLGLLPGSFWPHYDAEDQRKPLYLGAVASGELPPGYAVGNLDSLHFSGNMLVTAIPSASRPLALRVDREAGRAVESELPVVALA